MKIANIYNDRMINKKMFSNASWLVAERVYQMAINLILTMLTARYLGPSNYGLLNYTASFIAFFIPISTLGLEGVFVKELITHPNNEGMIIGSGLVMRIASSFISMVFIISIITIINPHDKLILILAAAQSLALLFRSFELIEFWYQSKLKSKISSIMKASAYTITALYKLMILLMNKNVVWFAFSITIELAIISLFSIISYHKYSGGKLSFSLIEAKNLLKQSYHFIFSGLLVAIYAQIDRVMIGKMLGREQVGYYAVAIVICGLWTFIPQALINSSRPLIMELSNQNTNEYIKRLKQLYSVIIWGGIGFASFITIFAKWIVLILYGKEYLAAVFVLRIAVWYTIFSSLGVARGIWIVCEKKNRYVKKYLFWGTIFNIILNWILIPTMGIQGAAFATLMTQLITTIVAPLFYKETRIHTFYIFDSINPKNIVFRNDS